VRGESLVRLAQVAQRQGRGVERRGELQRKVGRVGEQACNRGWPEMIWRTAAGARAWRGLEAACARRCVARNTRAGRRPTAAPRVCGGACRSGRSSGRSGARRSA
jgi:hypothetical protein